MPRRLLVVVAPELFQEQQRVVLGVLNNQHPQRLEAGRSAKLWQPYQGSSLSSSVLTKPVRTACSAAWVRLWTPSFLKMFETWDLTVFSSTNSSLAICLLDLPRATSVRISVSRSVRASGFSGALTSRIKLAAASGASWTLPSAAPLIARCSSSESA